MQILICPPRENERQRERERDVNLLTRNDNEDVISTEREEGRDTTEVRHNSPDCEIFYALPVVANAQFNILQAFKLLFSFIELGTIQPNKNIYI